MKKIITLSCFCLSFVALFFILGTQTACQKQSTNCPCTITVKDTNNNPVNAAIVRLYAPHSTAGALGQTNAAGVVNFNFSLPAIYNISAKYTVSPGDTLESSSYNIPVIQLQVGQTESTTVTVYKAY